MQGNTSTETGLIGADTSFLIDFFQGDKNAIAFMNENSHLIRACELVMYEFLCGNLSEGERKLFLDAMHSLPHVGFNREAALLASEAFRAAKRKGSSVGHADCMIAGSYLAHGIRKIVTRNKSHFEGIAGIKVIGY